jgi:serine protease 16
MTVNLVLLLPCLGFARPMLMMDNPRVAELSAGKYPSARYVTTKQDHFDSTNDNTWQQAYYVNDTFWVPGSDAPIFLCVGGEGPAIDGSAVVSSVHCNVAVEWLG